MEIQGKKEASMKQEQQRVEDAKRWKCTYPDFAEYKHLSLSRKQVEKLIEMLEGGLTWDDFVEQKGESESISSTPERAEMNHPQPTVKPNVTPPGVTPTKQPVYDSLGRKLSYVEVAVRDRVRAKIAEMKAEAEAKTNAEAETLNYPRDGRDIEKIKSIEKGTNVPERARRKFDPDKAARARKRERRWLTLQNDPFGYGLSPEDQMARQESLWMTNQIRQRPARIVKKFKDYLASQNPQTPEEVESIKIPPETGDFDRDFYPQAKKEYIAQMGKKIRATPFSGLSGKPVPLEIESEFGAPIKTKGHLLTVPDAPVPIYAAKVGKNYNAYVISPETGKAIQVGTPAKTSHQLMERLGMVPKSDWANSSVIKNILKSESGKVSPPTKQELKELVDKLIK